MVQTLSLGGSWADSGDGVLVSSHARVGLILRLWVKAISADPSTRRTTVRVAVRFRAPEARRIEWRNRSVYGNNARQMIISVDGRNYSEDIPNIIVGFGGHVDWEKDYTVYHLENGDAGEIEASVTIPGYMNSERLKIWFPNISSYDYEHFGYGSRSISFRVPNMTPKVGFLRNDFYSELGSLGFDDITNAWRTGGASSAQLHYNGTKICDLSSSNGIFSLTQAAHYQSLFNLDRTRSENAVLRYSGSSSTKDFYIGITYPNSYLFTSTGTSSGLSGQNISLPFKGRAFSIRSSISSASNFNVLKDRMGDKFKYDLNVEISFGDGTSTNIFRRGITAVNDRNHGFQGSGSSAYIDISIDTNNKNVVDNRIRALSKNNRNGKISVYINFYLGDYGLEPNYNSNTSNISWSSTTIDVINVQSVNANCKLVGTDATIKRLLGSNENYLIAGKGTGKVVIPAGMFKSEGSNIVSYEVSIDDTKIVGNASTNTTSGRFSLNAADEIAISNAYMRTIPTGYNTNNFTLTAYNDTGGSASASISCNVLSYSPPTVNYVARWSGSGSGITIEKGSSGLRVHPIYVSNSNRNGVTKDANVKIEYEGSGGGSSSTVKTAGNIFKNNVGNGTSVYSDNNGWISHININESIEIPGTNVDPSLSYTITVSAKDIFDSITTQKIVLPAWKPIIHLNGKLKSVFFGGYDAESNAYAPRILNDSVVFNSENILGRNQSNIAPYSVKTITSFKSSVFQAGVYRFSNIMGAEMDGIRNWDSNWTGIVENIVMNNVEFSGEAPAEPATITKGYVAGDFHTKDNNKESKGRGMMQRITIFNTGKVYSRTKLVGFDWTDWMELTSSEGSESSPSDTEDSPSTSNPSSGGPGAVKILKAGVDFDWVADSDLIKIDWLRHNAIVTTNDNVVHVDLNLIGSSKRDYTIRGFKLLKFRGGKYMPAGVQELLIYNIGSSSTSSTDNYKWYDMKARVGPTSNGNVMIWLEYVPLGNFHIHFSFAYDGQGLFTNFYGSSQDKNDNSLWTNIPWLYFNRRSGDSNTKFDESFPRE